MPCYLCNVNRETIAALSPADYPDACESCRSVMTPDSSTWRWSCVGEYTFRLEQANHHTEDDIIAAIDSDDDDDDMVGSGKPTLHELIERLKPTLQEVIYPYYFEGQTFKEIGDKLGISKQAVHGRVNRAIVKLRAMADSREDLDLGEDQ